MGECPSAPKAGTCDMFGTLARLDSVRELVLRREPAAAAGEREPGIVTTMGASLGKSHCWWLQERMESVCVCVCVCVGGGGGAGGRVREWGRP